MDSQTVVNTLKNDSTENYSISQEKGNEDAEISIFEAEKYFSEECNESKSNKQEKEKPSSHHDLLSVQRLQSSSSSFVEGYGRNLRTISFRAKLSEASWRSRIGFSNGFSLKNLASHRARKRLSAAKKWLLRRNCCCRGKKSVQVKEVTSELNCGGSIVLIDSMKSSNRNSNILLKEGDHSMKETTSESLPKFSITDNVVEIHHIATDSSSMDAPRQQRISATGRPFIDGAVGFTFPILSSSSSSDQAGNIFMEALRQPPPSRRPSMENHGIGRGPFHPGSPGVREDDAASDASSDLFEIESFSTQTTSCPMHCWWDSVDEVTNAARKSAAENGTTSVQHCRRGGDEEAAAAAWVRTAANRRYPAREVGVDCKLCCATTNTGDGCDKASSADGSVSTSEAGGSGRKANGDGSMLMRCRQEKAAAAKCLAEGKPVIQLPRGSSHAPPLQLAFVA